MDPSAIMAMAEDDVDGGSYSSGTESAASDALDGASDAEEEVAAPTAKRRKRDLLPTSEEAQALRAAETVIGGSLLELQAAELLNEVRPKYTGKAAKALEGFLFEVKEALEALPAKDVAAADVRGIPLCQPLAWHKEVKLAFRAPASVDVVGSYMLRAMAKPAQCVDVAFEMPRECFLPKDFLDHRYFDKKRLYVGHVASVLASRVGDDDCPFAGVAVACHRGDARRPTILLRARGSKALSKWCVRLVPQVAEDLFDPLKVVPTRCNVRPRAAAGVAADEEGERPPTPLYNNAIVYDMGGAKRHLAALFAITSDCPAFADAMVLARVWLGQRGMRSAADAPSGHLMGLILLHLAETRRISLRMSAAQMFVSLLAFLADAPLTGRPLRLRVGRGGVGLTDAGLRAFGDAFAVVLMDGSGRLNAAADVSRDAALELHAEARASLDLLRGRSAATAFAASAASQDGEDGEGAAAAPGEGAAAGAATGFGADAFQRVFLERRSFWQRWDYYVGVPLLPVGAGEDDGDEPPASVLLREEPALLREGDFRTALSGRVAALLRRALGDRHTALRSLTAANGAAGGVEDGVYEGPGVQLLAGAAPARVGEQRGPRGAEAPGAAGQILWVGLRLDLANAARRVERGPDARSGPAGAAFRDLWGKRAQLRRFRDGALVEAVVFADDGEAGDGAGARAAVLSDLLGAVLSRHEPRRSGGGMPLLRGAEMERVLSGAAVKGAAALPAAVDAFRGAIDAFDVLRGALVTAAADERMPLGIRSVAAVGEALRYTAMLQPTAHPLLGAAPSGATEATTTPPLSAWAVARLEHSSKLPDDALALLAAKAALCQRLSEILPDTSGGRVRVLAVSRLGWLEAAAGGHAFRVLLAADTEAALLGGGGESLPDEVARAAGQAGEAGAAAVPSLVATPADFALHFARRPTLHALLHGFATRVPTFGPAARLAKRWLSAHLLLPHFGGDLVDLLVAAAFQAAGADAVPSSAHAGFLAFLSLLARADFRAEPLLVDLNGAGTSGLARTATKAFEAARAGAGGGPALFACVPQDAEHGFDAAWSRAAPERVVLARAQALAGACAADIVRWTQRGGDRGARLPRGIFGAAPVEGAPGAVVVIRDEWLCGDAGRRGGADGTCLEAAAAALRGAPAMREKVFKNTIAQAAERLLVGADPVRELADRIEAEMGDKVLVLHAGGAFAGPWAREIRAVWRPAAFVPKPFGVMQAAHAAPVGDGAAGFLVPNVPQLLAEMRSLGEGLIERIDLL